MKYITSLILVFTLNMTAVASIIPENAVIIDHPAIKLLLSDIEHKQFFLKTEFDTENLTVFFEMTDNIKYLQIYDTQGWIKYQLNVDAYKVKFGLDILENSDMVRLILADDVYIEMESTRGNRI